MTLYLCKAGGRGDAKNTEQRKEKYGTPTVLTQGRAGELKKDILNLMCRKKGRTKDQTQIRERRKEKRKGRDGEASNPGPEEKKRLRIQQVNITNVDKNGHALMNSDADVIRCVRT